MLALTATHLVKFCGERDVAVIVSAHFWGQRNLTIIMSAHSGSARTVVIANSAFGVVAEKQQSIRAFMAPAGLGPSNPPGELCPGPLAHACSGPAALPGARTPAGQATLFMGEPRQNAALRQTSGKAKIPGAKALRRGGQATMREFLPRMSASCRPGQGTVGGLGTGADVRQRARQGCGDAMSMGAYLNVNCTRSASFVRASPPDGGPSAGDGVLSNTTMSGAHGDLEGASIQSGCLEDCRGTRYNPCAALGEPERTATLHDPPVSQVRVLQNAAVSSNERVQCGVASNNEQSSSLFASEAAERAFQEVFAASEDSEALCFMDDALVDAVGAAEGLREGGAGPGWHRQGVGNSNGSDAWQREPFGIQGLGTDAREEAFAAAGGIQEWEEAGANHREGDSSGEPGVEQRGGSVELGKRKEGEGGRNGRRGGWCGDEDAAGVAGRRKEGEGGRNGSPEGGCGIEGAGGKAGSGKEGEGRRTGTGEGGCGNEGAAGEAGSGKEGAAAAWKRIADLMRPPRCKGHGEECVVRHVKKAGVNQGTALHGSVG